MLLFYLIFMINSFNIFKFWGVFSCIDNTWTADPANKKKRFYFHFLQGIKDNFCHKLLVLLLLTSITN